MLENVVILMPCNDFFKLFFKKNPPNVIGDAQVFIKVKLMQGQKSLIRYDER